MLFDQINDMISKSKLGQESKYQPSYSTGMDVMDYKNGFVSDDGEVITGVDSGKIITIIGKSGSGKTSLALEMASSIVEDFEEGVIYHLDFERAMSASAQTSRFATISGWDKDTIKSKYKILNRDIYSETLYKLIRGIDKIKNDPENFDRIKIDTGKVDEEGETIYALPPTVVIVDSWVTMIPKDISEEEELSGSMSASSIAKTNNAVCKRIVGPLERGNITLIIINHITKKIEVSSFAKTQADINYLKQDESIPGGSSCIYLCNNLIRLVTGSKLDKDSTYGVKGFIVNGEFVKSRTSEAGIPFTMVFVQSRGFDNVLTNLANFKEMGILKGSPRAYYLEECPDIKFTLKTFEEKYYESEELRNAVQEIIEREYQSLLPEIPEFIKKNQEEYEEDEETDDEYEEDENSDDEDDEEIELVKCVNKVKDIWLGSDGNYYTSDGDEVNYKPKKK